MDDESNCRYNYNDNQLDEQVDNNYEHMNKKCTRRKQMRKYIIMSKKI